IYREARLTSVYANPFATGEETFFEWLRAPWREGSFISTLFATLHARTPELKAMFPSLGGEAELGLLLHVNAAADLYGLPTELVDDAPRRVAAQLDTAPAAPESSRQLTT